MANLSSPSSPVQNHPQIEVKKGENGDNKGDDGQDLQTPPQNPQNHAQNDPVVTVTTGDDKNVDFGEGNESPIIWQLVSEQEIRDVVQRAMIDEEGNTKGHFTRQDFDTRVLPTAKPGSEFLGD